MAAGVLGGSAYFLATRIDRVALARALQKTDYLLVLAMTVGHLIVVLPIKAWRWGRMLAPIRRLPLRRLYEYCLAGCAVSNLIPARAGHAVRVLLLRRDGVPLAAAVGTILLEEIYNVLVLALLALPLPWVLPLSGRVSATLRLVAVGAGLGVAAAFWLAAAGRARPSGLLRRLSGGLAPLSAARSAVGGGGGPGAALRASPAAIGRSRPAVRCALGDGGPRAILRDVAPRHRTGPAGDGRGRRGAKVLRRDPRAPLRQPGQCGPGDPRPDRPVRGGGRRRPRHRPRHPGAGARRPRALPHDAAHPGNRPGLPGAGAQRSRPARAARDCDGPSVRRLWGLARSSEGRGCWGNLSGALA